MNPERVALLDAQAIVIGHKATIAAQDFIVQEHGRQHYRDVRFKQNTEAATFRSLSPTHHNAYFKAWRALRAAERLS